MSATMMNHAACTPRHHTLRRPAPARLSALADAVDRLLRMIDTARSRHGLAALDEHALKDIGLSRADAEYEAKRHFWDV